jgi:hypothetical protein
MKKARSKREFLSVQQKTTRHSREGGNPALVLQPRLI